MLKKELCISKEDFVHDNYNRFFVVADVGGTHTTVAILGVKERRKYDLIFKALFNTSAISDISYMLNDVLKQAKENYDIESTTAAICAAGPVPGLRDKISLTNANLVISRKSIISKTMLKTVALLNDFEAIAYGIDLLDMKKDVIALSSPKNARPGQGQCAVIGAGTGLGMSILAYDGVHNTHVPLASEGGHITLSCSTDIEWEFYNYLKKSVLDNKEPDMESAVSGSGIEAIYNFIRQKKMFPATDITRRADSLTDPEKLHEIDISYDADNTCRKTLDMFMAFYARAAKNLALISECYGSLFMCGTITLKLLEVLRKSPFVSEFLKHDKKSELLKRIPIYVVTNKDIPLYGCANFVLNY